MTNAVRENDKLLFRAVFLFGPKTPHRRLMKKFNLSKKLLALVLTLAALFTVLCGCADPNPDAIKGTATVVIAETETKTFSINFEDAKLTKNSNAYDLLAYLHEKENLALETTDGAYGKSLNKVGQLVNGADGKYIYVYTSVEQDFDVSAYATTVTYDNKTLTSSGVSISSMHITDGCIIYITLITF